MYKVFDYNETQVKDLLWVNLMTEVRKGVFGLTSAYNVKSKKWKQAHAQGAWVITQWIYRNQKQKVIDFETIGDYKDFMIKIDKELLMTEGHQLIGELLNILQVYKSAGAVDRAQKLYDDYSSVSDMFLKYRDIVISKRRPGSLRSYPNLVLNTTAQAKPSLAQARTGGQVNVKEYEESIHGLIQSFAERYPFNEELYNQVTREWNKHKLDLKINRT